MMLQRAAQPQEARLPYVWQGRGWEGRGRGRNVKGTGRSWLGLRRERGKQARGLGKHPAERGMEGPSQARWEAG